MNCQHCGAEFEVASPTNKIVIPVLVDTAWINYAIIQADIALKKAEKIKANLSDAKEIIGRANISFEIKNDNQPEDELKKKILAAFKNGDIKINIDFGEDRKND